LSSGGRFVKNIFNYWLLLEFNSALPHRSKYKIKSLQDFLKFYICDYPCSPVVKINHAHFVYLSYRHRRSGGNDLSRLPWPENLIMSKKKWFILAAAVLALGVVVVALVLALVLGFFAGHEEAAGTDPGLPVYTLDQSASAHAGYRHTTLTSGNDVYVSDYEEASLRLVTSEPKPAIGRYGIGSGNVCAIPDQPTTAYIAGDDGSEMPAYEPFRNIKQPPFDWRTATFREMNFLPPGGRSNWRQSTNTALIAEIVRVLREGSPVELPAFPFTGMNTNLTAINMTSDQLPGLLFCPPVYLDGNGTLYLAESFTIDWTPRPAEVHAHWIPASPMLTQWLKAP
jgi:hypothetical protein